jgi:hypothetical protein
MRNYLAVVAVFTTLTACTEATQTVPAPQNLTDNRCVPVVSKESGISCPAPTYSSIAEAWRGRAKRPSSGTATAPVKTTPG